MRILILASSSPRRKELLTRLGLKFTVDPGEIDEVLMPSLTPRKQVEALSLQKALFVGKRYTDALILSADTMVVLRSEMLGKPRDTEEAKMMLKKLSGTVHSIITCFTLFETKTGKIITKVTETKIWFREITNTEIISFVKKEKPFDKAGAYAIHELGAIFIKKIEGDYTGAIGLSLFHLSKALRKFGVETL